MSVTLDAGAVPPVGVNSPSFMSVYVGDPPKQLLIFTGVAVPEWDSEGDLDREDVIVRLGVTTTQFYQWTATASLASIGNENTDFTFSTDGATVENADDGSLQLRVPIAVQGGSSILHRFSYLVQVFSDPVEAKVIGTISWDQEYGAPTSMISDGGYPMFRIAIGQTTIVPSSSGGLSSTKFVEETSGFSSPPVQTGTRWVASYEVDGLPFGPVWQVVPSLEPNALDGPPVETYLPTPLFSPQQELELTPATPSASGVDFVMTFSTVPR